MNISTLKSKGFEGQDINLNIALGEYGICWKQFKRATKNAKKGEYLFYYGVRYDTGEGILNEDDDTPVNDYTGWALFDWCYLKPEEFTRDYDWCEFNEVCDFCGMTEEGWLELPFEQRICDLAQYYGHDEIFGTCYNPFKIGGIYE